MVIPHRARVRCNFLQTWEQPPGCSLFGRLVGVAQAQKCERSDIMFPINDEPSAHLMLEKAPGLLQSGSIEIAEAAAVFRKASEAIYRRERQLRSNGYYAPEAAIRISSSRERVVTS
jgi:hypothetical protein